MVSFKGLLSEPKYAACIAAVIALTAKWLDNKLSGTKGTLLGYLKAMVFSAGLVGVWVYALSGASTVSTSSASAASVGAAEFARRPPPFGANY